MKLVIKRIMFFILPLIFILGCDEPSDINENDTIHGSGRIVSQTRNVDECNGITIHSVGDVYLTQDTVQSIRIEADDNIIENVITKKENGILLVGLPEGSYSNVTLRIYVSLKTIQSISINGAGNLNTQNMIECNELNCGINGAGNINLKGSGNYLNCLINGAGNIDAEKFVAKKCKAFVNGAGNCTVYASEELDATVNGVGNIYYYGNPPIVKTSITGLGQIIKR